MDAKSTVALVERARAEPDVGERARLLNVDLRAVAATHRRAVVILWSIAVAVASAVLLSRTLRLGLVAGHGQWDPWIKFYLNLVAQGAIALVVGVWVVSTLVHPLLHRIARALKRHQRWSVVTVTLVSAAVLPGVGAGLALLGAREPTFLLGVVVGTPIAIARARSPLNIAKRVAQNNPWVVSFLAAQSDLEVRNGLIENRLRWLIVELATAVMGATAMMLLIVVAPVSAIPLALVDAGIGCALSVSLKAGRERTGRLIDLAVTVVIVAVALAVGGGFLLPTVTFGALPVPV
ncbi:MAG: hypothetical protein ABIO06_08515 [Pseudolysinimonas sp.]